MKTTQFRDEESNGIKWSSFGPYFDGSYLVRTPPSVPCFGHVNLMSNVLKNRPTKYHPHTRRNVTYPLTEATLFRSDARPPYWMKGTAVAFNLAFVFLMLYHFKKIVVKLEIIKLVKYLSE